MKKNLLLALEGTALLLVGCVPLVAVSPTIVSIPTPTSVPSQEPSLSLPPLTASNYPLVDGSTSAYPLQIMLACQMLGVSCNWTDAPFGGIERMMWPDPTYSSDDPRLTTIYNIAHSGTHQSYVNLIEGSADFILVARSPSDDELSAAQAAGVELDVRPVALDAFVFLVNVQNPVDDLSLEAIRDIYTGQTTHWTEVGGGTAPQGGGDEIQAYQRDQNSGSQELMESLVMRDLPMIDAPDMILIGMAGPFNIISTDPLGLGYSVYFYATFMLPDPNVKLIGIDGLHPTSETIANRSYPLTTEVYVVLRADTPPDSSAATLRDWLFTEAGKAAIVQSGYIPLP